VNIIAKKSADFDIICSKDSETLRSTSKLGPIEDDPQESKFNRRI
jgi:hypothetical protein